MPNPRDSINWDVTEGPHRGQWTRDDEGGKDEQRFLHYEGSVEMKVHYAGDKVYVERYKPGDLHFYHGTVSADGRTISGKYLIQSYTHVGDWSAQVNY